MTTSTSPSIRIAAGLIVDSVGRVLLVRKRGTKTFMQAGGKIEADERPYDGLARELEEELGLRVTPHAPEYLGEFTAVAANETNRMVQADVFYLRADAALFPGREIEEIKWITPSDTTLPLAPLTQRLLPIAR